MRLKDVNTNDFKLKVLDSEDPTVVVIWGAG